MAHIPDGIVSAPVLLGGAALAVAGVAIALRQLDDRAIPRTATLSATFFAGSLIAIPVGPSSVHLLFGGLIGVMLGFMAFPAVLVALLLQTVLFGFGGLTTLGVNTVNIALPAVLTGLALGPAIRAASPRRAAVLAAISGALAVTGTGALVALSLWLSSAQYAPVAKVMLATYLPLALGEAAVTGAAVGFLARVQPEALRPVTA
ncbi:MAG: cobalt transporter CbiM [Gammaproteobacteria bacterium]|nr:cobalt transporter CbiM [Gammaproteobacteria bacterium]